MELQFNTIPQYQAYEVSLCGTVVRRIINKKPVTLSKQTIKGKETGYIYCALIWNEAGRRIKNKRIAVHRLVALAHISPPQTPKHVWINHKDGNKANNNAFNLEWSTISENIQHAIRTGLKTFKSGKDHPAYGRKHSEAARKLMSEAKKGDKHPKRIAMKVKNGL